MSTVRDALEQARKAALARAMGLQEWQLDAMRAVPDNLMRDVIADGYKGISQSASLIPDRQRSQDKPRAPSGGTAPIQQPPGLNYVDALCHAADRRDRTARVQQEMELAEIERRLDRRNPYRCQTEYDPLDKKRLGHDDE